MSTTSAAPARPGAPADGTSSPLDAARGFGVMLGGPLVLLGGVTAAALHASGAVHGGRRPRPAAVALLGAAVAYHRWMLPWMRGWGATDAEIGMTLPGDELTPNASVVQTRAVEVDAPADLVWSWLAQIGQDRGGFYSYTWLENLAGCRMTNADRVHPEWQDREIGATVLLHPASGLKVLRFAPARALVLEGGWSLVVQEHGPARCRLLARFRAPRGVAGKAYALLLELPHFVMERKMLLEIKRRAERPS